MISVLLARARDYEAERLPKISPAVLPRFHVTGGVGWLNDPNGFSLYRGEYHLFFQYYPYATHWSDMHWGHVKTRDFIHWEHLPCAMAPDMQYDCRGCFSGSAVELPDGRHLLMYTGVGNTSDGGEVQTQCIAFGDGVDYEKYEGNPVIDSKLLPEGGSSVHFRDPKICKTDDGWRAVAGNLCSDGNGAVLMFKSPDALNWQYAGKVASSDNRFGRMWECPDLFRLDGKDVLILSPQEVRGDNLDFLNGNTTLCLIGSLAPDNSLNREAEQTVDYGLDFYAPQTLLTADGRRVIIAWMQYWNSVDVRPVKELPFFGQMTLPRELRVENGRLIQNPVRELEACRGERVAHSKVMIAEKTELPGVNGRCLDLTVSVRPGGSGEFRRFNLNVAEGCGYLTSICFHPNENTVLVDRSKSGWPQEVMNRKMFAVDDKNGEITLRIILDRYSMEIFVNGGEQAATFVLFAPEEADGISFEAEGTAEADIECFTLLI